MKKIRISLIIEFLYVLNSLLLIFYIYLLNKSIFFLPSILKIKILSYKLGKELYTIIKNFRILFFGIIYLLFLLLITYLLLKYTKKLKNIEEIKENTVIEIENANESFLPSYLGYFFVALSINDLQLLIIVFIIILIFVYKSQFAHFNPLLLLLGYKYYYYKIGNSKNLLITKKILKKSEEVKISKLIRLNDFTFLDIEEKV